MVYDNPESRVHRLMWDIKNIPENERGMCEIIIRKCPTKTEAWRFELYPSDMEHLIRCYTIGAAVLETVRENVGTEKKE